MLIDVKCAGCGTEEERLVKDSSHFTVICPSCEHMNTEEQRVDTPGKGGTFVLKGGGWFNSEGGY